MKLSLMDQYLILGNAVYCLPSQAGWWWQWGRGDREAPISEGLCLVPGTFLTLVKVLPAGLVFAPVNSPGN